MFLVVGVDCFVYTASSGALVTTLTNIVNAGSSYVGFTQFLKSTGITTLVITDGTKLSEISTALAVTVAGAGFPTPHLPYPIYFDGYLLLVKSATADCYNSNLDNPLVYTAGDFINTESSPDLVTGITTINNYFVLLGSDSIEFFFDAGNPTGTPFQRNDVFVKLNGYYGGLAKYGNDIYLVSVADSGVPDVYVMRDFKLQPVGNNAIRKYLAAQGVGTTYTGSIISLNGTACYVFQNGGTCYCLDIQSGLWGTIEYSNTSTFRFINTEQSILSGAGTYFVLSSTTTSIFYFNQAVYQDSGATLTATVVTPKFDNNTNHQKYLGSFILKCDRPAAATTSSFINVSWTDNDYQTYNTPRTIELQQEQPNIQQLGRFRKRAFKFTHSDNIPLKITSIEADINMGIT
jgi:hypothetical protein